MGNSTYEFGDEDAPLFGRSAAQALRNAPDGHATDILAFREEVAKIAVGSFLAVTH